jgi:hypothetical protein
MAGLVTAAADAVSVPDADPATLGVKTTETVQLLPPANAPVQ